jgi:uncharacterized PurR-regulated membrane protein YhhQ (DUF165 family)
MWLVVLFGLIVAVSRFAAHEVGYVTYFGYTFTAGTGLLAALLPLRDIIQERNNRRYALVAMFVGLLIGVMFFGGNGLVIAIALFWTEVVDFAVFTSLRKYGWGVAMVASDLISAPLTPLIGFWLINGTVGMPNGQLIAKLATLAIIYAVFFATNLPEKITGLPLWRHPRRAEAIQGEL